MGEEVPGSTDLAGDGRRIQSEAACHQSDG